MFDDHGYQRPPAPEAKKYNLSIAEAGAVRMAGYIQRGQPHPCSRYGGMVDPAECAAWMRPLCSECSIGVIVRQKYPHHIPVKQEDTMPLQEPHMIDCPGCGRRMKHKGRGYCARCYHYLRLGKRIPPLDPDGEPCQANDTTPSDAESRTVVTKSTESEWAPTNINQIKMLEGDAANDLRMQLDLEGLLGADEVMEWLDAMAAVELRTIDAQALYVLRGVMDKEARA